MEEIKTIEELVQAMRLNGLETKESIENYFPKLAKALINNFAICRSGKEYRFVEIEFYHNLTDDGGKKITYNRETESCNYFFHSSGVDLSFESNKEKYGGILIRSICGDKLICGPGRVADELFDKFSAWQVPTDDFPLLVPLKDAENVSPVASKRWLGKTNADDKDYRYSWPKEKWEQWKEKQMPKNYSAYPWNEKK